MSRTRTCAHNECLAKPFRGGLCKGHYERAQAGWLAVEQPVGPKERLLEAAVRIAEAEEDTDFDKAWDNLRKAAEAFAKRLSKPGSPE